MQENYLPSTLTGGAVYITYSSPGSNQFVFSMDGTLLKGGFGIAYVVATVYVIRAVSTLVRILHSRC